MKECNPDSNLTRTADTAVSFTTMRTFPLTMLRKCGTLIMIGILVLVIIANWKAFIDVGNDTNVVRRKIHETVNVTDRSPIWKCAKAAILDKGNSADEDIGGVVILTPIYNSEKYLSRYFQNLCDFSYSHHKISVVLGEDSSSDKTHGVAKGYAEKLRQYFRRVEVVDLSFVTAHEPWHKAHDEHIQLQRRRQLAMSRNALLLAGLKSEDWVLWLDVDVKEMPPDIIERLLKPAKDIIVPSCMYHKPITGYPALYDRNSWRETNISRKYLKHKPKAFLMLEGYSTSKRDFINKLGRQGSVVELDGVGGCVLLIRADCHRKGLIFPPFVYNHHIETEGLAKMAKDMGFGVYGIPNLHVFHS